MRFGRSSTGHDPARRRANQNAAPAVTASGELERPAPVRIEIVGEINGNGRRREPQESGDGWSYATKDPDRPGQQAGSDPGAADPPAQAGTLGVLCSQAGHSSPSKNLAVCRWARAARTALRERSRRPA